MALPPHRRLSIMMLIFLAASLVFSLTSNLAAAQDEVPAEEPVAAETVAEEPATVEQPVVEQPATEPAPQETVQQEEQAPPPPALGTLEIRLTGSTGGALSGLFAITDAAGANYERWTENGTIWLSGLPAGTTWVTQLDGTTDFALAPETLSIHVPEGGHAVLPVNNAFLDADGDAYGDSVDICPGGSDAIDTDGDATPDACDDTPNGDTDGDGIDELGDPTPNGDDDADGVDNAVDACPAGDDALDADGDGTADACDETPNGAPTEEPAPETSLVVAEVAAEPAIIEGATVICENLVGLAPSIATDLAEYAPGAVTTLTGAGWAPGQLVTIATDDDGTVDAAQGDWTATAEVTADETGAFSHQVTLAAEVAASYRVVATGQCAPGGTSEIVAEVSAEPEVVKEAPVTCQQADAVQPWIATDLADYPPGATVTLTGGTWVPGQTIEILVEDDGVADAERGPWNHTATVTADAQGNFTYQFALAPWFVADYSVIATGECTEARTTFTDTIQMSASLTPTQVPTSTSIAFTMTITNTTTSPDNTATNNLGCVRIALAGGYTAVNASSLSVSAGKSWTIQSVLNTEIVLLANNDSSRLAANEGVTLQFNATSPSGAGSSNLSASGRTGSPTACPSGGSEFAQQNINVTRISRDVAASASITPSSVQASTTQSFTVRINNHSTTWELCSAKVLIPTGFGNPTSVSFSGAGFKGPVNGWTFTYSTSGGDARKIVMKAANGDGCIDKGTNGHISVTFASVVTSTVGSYTFTAEAWKLSDHGSDKFTTTSQPVLTVTAATGPCTPTAGLAGAELDFNSLTWNGTAYPTGSDTLAILISSSGSGCSGFPANWSVTASTSVMNRTGGGGTIPANAIGYTGTASGSPPSNLTPSGPTQLGGTAQTIAIGIATTATGTWNAGFSLAPPATSVDGSYTGTITITATTGS